MRSFRSDEIALWAALAVAFAPGVATLSAYWAATEYHQHGFLVPWVSLAAAWPLFARLGPPRREPRALLAVGGAVALYGVGVVVASGMLQGLALVGALAALAGHRFGASGVRRLSFPLAFLLFMVPLPETWVFPVIVELQQWASAGAVAVLRVLGVSVHREGNVIHLASGDSLFVAEACSGITSLVSLIPVGVILARFTQRGRGRRLALVAAVVPAALLCNAVRVIATVVVAERIGAARATSGPLHESAGLLTSAFAVLLVMGFGALIGRPRRAGTAP